MKLKINNLITRLITSFIAVPILVFVLYLGEIVFLFFTSVFIVLAVKEYFDLIKDHPKKPYFSVVLICSLLIAVGAYNSFITLMAFFTLMMLVIVTTRLNSDDIPDFVRSIGVSVFPVLYFGWFLSHGILIRNISFDSSIMEFSNKELGLQDPGFFFILITFACSFLSDTGAFFVGKNFGKYKLSPAISPNKTVEGTIGGLLVSVLSALMFNALFSNPLNWQWCVIYGLVIGTAATLGDLVESGLKREVGVKDSGNSFPGHGGTLDRIDSLFFVFPVVYYLTIFFFYMKRDMF